MRGTIEDLYHDQYGNTYVWVRATNGIDFELRLGQCAPDFDEDDMVGKEITFHGKLVGATSTGYLSPVSERASTINRQRPRDSCKV